MSFNDTNGLPGVEGTVTYTGSRGPVSDERPILVEAFRDADLTDQLQQPNRLLNNGDPYMFLLVEDHPHYLRAFLDLDNSGRVDDGEPFTIFDGNTAPPGDPIPQDGSMVDITFGDAGPPTPCVGDCNGDGVVTVAENVTGINLALGRKNVSECPAFDPSGSGTVTVDKLLQGVSNGLNGCPGNV